MSFNTKALREKRMKLATEANALLRQTPQTTEIRTMVSRLLDECDRLGSQVEREEREEALSTFSAQRESDRFQALELPREREYRMAFNSYLRNGINRMTNEEREMVFSRRDIEKRDQLAGTQSIAYTQGTAGGYFVPAGFVYDVEVALKYFAPLIDGTVVRLLETATGNVLPYPTSNDVQNSAVILGEAQSVSELDVTMGVVTFGAWKYTSQVVRVSLELLQDSAFDLESFLKQQFAIRFGRAYERDCTVGNGVNRPTGIITAVLASGISPVIATGSSTNDGSGNTGTNSIGTNDLVALEHSVDPAYRRGARFMFHDSALKGIKQLLDKYGRPIWLPGLAANAPDTVLGYPYTINQSMDAINSFGVNSPSKNAVLFGDTQKFVIRKVKDMSVLRLDERYADFGEVAFLAFSRIDSNLAWSGTGAYAPLNILQMHS